MVGKCIFVRRMRFVFFCFFFSFLFISHLMHFLKVNVGYLSEDQNDYFPKIFFYHSHGTTIVETDNKSWNFWKDADSNEGCSLINHDVFHRETCLFFFVCLFLFVFVCFCLFSVHYKFLS